MDTLVREIEKIPLSGDDLQQQAMKMGNMKTKWMVYDDLGARNTDGTFVFKNISQVFITPRGRLNTVFVLLRIQNHSHSEVGHWIALIQNEMNGNISYYDPYALTIEQDLAVTGERDFLTRLLSGVNVDVNKHQHQKFKNEVQVCGRHTVIRSIFHFFTNDQYHNKVIAPLIKSRQVCDPDTLVSLMTVFLSKSDEVVRSFFSKIPKQTNTLTRIPLGVISKDPTPPPRHRGLGGSVV